MFQLPDLPYDHNALEPYLDARTMELHHGKHHAGYVNNLNKALEQAGVESTDLTTLLANLNDVPEAFRGAVRNNGGQHFNHSLFWQTMSPNGNSEISAELKQAIEHDLGGMDELKKLLLNAAATTFGSGWGWLSLNAGKLEVYGAPNQGNPILDGRGAPLLTVDVWEHAYYLMYQNRRPDFLENWWNLINWKEVSALYTKAK